MKNRIKYSAVLIFLLVFAINAFAQDNKAYLKDGKIVVETNEGVKAIDYNHEIQSVQKISEKWTVKEEINPVEEGLAVFKNKSTPVYLKRIVLLDKEHGDDFIFEFYTDDKSHQTTYSPNKDYLYFLGTSSDGITSVYGHNIYTKKQFLIPDSRDFQLLNCENQTSFIVVEKDEKEGDYFIYDLGGKELNHYSNLNAYDKLKNSVCHE